MQDILLDEHDNLLIDRGDWQLGDSHQQHVQLLLTVRPCRARWSRLNGPWERFAQTPCRLSRGSSPTPPTFWVGSSGTGSFVAPSRPTLPQSAEPFSWMIPGCARDPLAAPGRSDDKSGRDFDLKIASVDSTAGHYTEQFP